MKHCRCKCVCPYAKERDTDHVFKPRKMNPSCGICNEYFSLLKLHFGQSNKLRMSLMISFFFIEAQNKYKEFRIQIPSVWIPE